METMHPTSGSAPATSGKSLFIAGCITLLLFSVVHLIPFTIGTFVEPTNPLEIEAHRATSAVKVDMGPFHTDFSMLFQLLSASYSALMFFVVALNFAALSAVIGAGTLRRLSMVNAVFAAVLLVISLIYRFPPPGVFSLIALVLFVAAFMRAGVGRP